LVAGQVDFGCDQIVNVVSQVQAGTINAARSRIRDMNRIKLCVALAVVPILVAFQQRPASQQVEWLYYGSDQAGTKYSRLADINSGNCVFAEYHGFITVDYDPATVPNTASSSVVHTFQLAPKNGGSGQTFIYVGNTPFAGLAPAGAYPLPTGDWQPELDPTRPYCLGISAFGDGDIARLPLASQSVCADVVQLSAAGAPPPPGTAGGGCAIVGRGAAGWLGVATFALLAVAIRSRRRRR